MALILRLLREAAHVVRTEIYGRKLDQVHRKANTATLVNDRTYPSQLKRLACICKL